MPQDSETPIYSCPNCKTKLKFKQAWMLTKFSEPNCESCQQALKPIESSVPRIHAFSGLAGGIVGYLCYHSMGLAVALIVVPWVMLFNCWFSTLVVRFEKREA